MTAEATKRSRRSKRIGANAERNIAAMFGTKRFLANTGGPLDIIPLEDGVHVQVKAGATVTTAAHATGRSS